jgi:hypothetical protein
MAGGGCKWGKNFEFVLGYINIMGMLQYGIKHYSRNNYVEIFCKNKLFVTFY